MSIVTTVLRRGVAAAAAGALILSGLSAIVATPAGAAAGDPLPETVSADALPTVQIDGVAWKQVVVGQTVYVGGSFTKARPAGVAAGGAGEVARSNILAYNLVTGQLIASFAPVFNGQINDLVASPDGRTLYVTGNFSRINDVFRSRAAALDIPSGTLKSWHPNLNSYGKGIAYGSNGTVYVAGNFTLTGSTTRQRVAAFDPVTAAVLPFNVPVDDRQVNSVRVSPDGTTVVIGGNFTAVGGVSNPGYGLARLDATTGASLPLPINDIIRNAGDNSAINTLNSDDTGWYGDGWHYGRGGTTEGSFKVSWDTGELIWLEDCHGDTYAVQPFRGVVYAASHKHYCGNSGGFPQTDPWSFHHGTAVTDDVRGVNTADIYGYPDHPGTPRPQFLEWYPAFVPGTFTGQDQGPWTVAAAGDYVLYGGEFLGVNNTPQQGLVRFAVRSIAPNKVGPENKGPYFGLAGSSYASGLVRLSWPGNPDKDDATVRYDLYRNSTSSAPIFTQTVTAPFWQQPTMTFTDKNQTPGSTQRYRVIATDPYGNQAMSDWINVTVSDAVISPYALGVMDDNPTSFWRLGEPSGTIAFDWTGASDQNLNAGVTLGSAGAINGDANTAARFSGTNTGYSAGTNAVAGPDIFSIEAWINTTTTRGGKIVGFGNNQTGNSTSYDRHVYMTNNGRIAFGVYPGAARTITSTTSYNDGAWHHVVATLSSGGMQLFIDGKRVAQRTDTTSGQAYSGYWRIGGDNLSSWSSQPSSSYFSGVIDDVAIYPGALTLTQIRAHFTASGRTVDLPPAPTDAYGALVHSAEPDLFWRFNEASGSSLTDSGTIGNNGALNGSYSRVSGGPVAGVTNNRSVSFTSGGGTAYSTARFVNPNPYTLEAWFKTTSTRGGKIIGLGSSQTGSSSSYDRHVYMRDDGTLVFGVWTGAENTIASPLAYNNGEWHHVMATQGASGMVLYVDGQTVGTNPQTAAQDYAGYWRVGGDTVWAGASQTNLIGQFDEVAVYPRTLTAQDALLHFGVGATGTAPNLPPIATGTATLVGRTLTVTGSGTDTDGTVVGYGWDFGDGVTATAANPPTHTYALSGTYMVTLTVTDDQGATGVWQQSVTVENAAPVPVFGVVTHYLDASFDAAGTVDPDGSVSTYAWTFGDGATASGATASHTYATGGTFPVTLTVTDNEGKQTALTQDVTVAPNQAPVAAFVVQPAGLSVTFVPTGTGDPDGAVASYAWTFGDGATSTAASPTHVYATEGTFPVMLIVTDGEGLSSVPATSNVVVVANKPPVADFTPVITDQSLSVTASASDPDGSVVAYTWLFGDGAQAMGATAQHTYAAPGLYAVTLTVRDDLGAETTLSKDVAATAPTVFARDAFPRTTTSGWGTADLGGVWTNFGSASQYAASGGTGVITFQQAGYTPRLQLRSVSALDIDETVQFSLDKIGNGSGTYVSLTSRGNTWSSLYRSRVLVKADGTLNLSFSRLAPAEATIASANLASPALAAGQVLYVRAQTVGSNPTTLRLKVWTGATEPAGWQLTATDSTAELQDAGAVGIDTVLSSSATNAPVKASFDNFVAGTPGAVVAPNTPPVAEFTAAVTNLLVSFDAAPSSDSDGSVLGWSWDFGDGSAAGSGTQVQHTYAAAGTYQVTLTVTDDDSATASVTHPASVTAPAGQVVVAQDAFSRTLATDWGSAEIGGAWTRFGAANQYSVDPGVGSLKALQAGWTPRMRLAGVAELDTDVVSSFSLDKIGDGGGTTLALTSRVGAWSSLYRARTWVKGDKTVNVSVSRLAPAETTLAQVNAAGLTVNAGDTINVRVQTQGANPTTIRMRVWLAGTAEPSTWQVTATDATPELQDAGSLGFDGLLSGSSTNAPVIIQIRSFVAVRLED